MRKRPNYIRLAGYREVGYDAAAKKYKLKNLKTGAVEIWRAIPDAPECCGIIHKDKKLEFVKDEKEPDDETGLFGPRNK